MSGKSTIEIERKFLVNPERWQQTEKPEGKLIRQGYLRNQDGLTIRIRIMGDEAFLTLKGETTGYSRREFEYQIPVEDASVLFDAYCKSSLVKIRYTLDYHGKTWEVDEFLGSNKGLFLAEIELETEDEVFELPEWIDREVSGDARYFNSALSIKPFLHW